jgi:hypothetical protein
MHLKIYKAASILLIVLSNAVSGQETVKEDTVKIREVVIRRERGTAPLPGFKRNSVDSTLLKYYNLFPLTETLNENSQLFFKSYGGGSLASTSFRGAGASRTQVAWNGVNLNDPMTGQSDFSLLPSGMADAIIISYGAASMEYGFGGIGGLINLETRPEFSRSTMVELTPGTGSFGTYSGMVKVRTGNANFQSSTKAWLTSAQNDFPFMNLDANPVPERETRKNGAVLQKGFLQELSFRSVRNITSARVWYQTASRHLPGSTLSEVPDSAEYQFDESLRTQVSSEEKIGKTRIFINGTWIFSRLTYEFPKYYIDSRNKSNSTVLRGGITQSISERTSFDLVLSDEFNSVRSINYSGPASRNTLAATITFKHRTGERLGTSLMVREIYVRMDSLSALPEGNTTTHGFLAPDFSVGTEFRIIRGKEQYLKLNVSRNSSLPTMNDLYWSYGGNQGLKNEYSWTGEAGYSLKKAYISGAEVKGEFTLFSNRIKNMISWYPLTEYFWTAGNIGRVNINGFESSASIKLIYGSYKLSVSGGYSYTRALEDSSDPSSDGKQLIYVPRNRANASLLVSRKNIYGSWMVNATGRAFITSDNSQYLRGYTLQSLIAGFKFRPWGSLVDLNFRITNIFNVGYEAVAHYPQPGRAWFVSVLYSFNSKERGE